MGTSKMLTRQLEVMLRPGGNPGLGPKQASTHTGRPVWTVCWKHCYQRTSRNACEGHVRVWPPAESLWQGIRLVPLWALFHSVATSVKTATGPAGENWKRTRRPGCHPSCPAAVVHFNREEAEYCTLARGGTLP